MKDVQKTVKTPFILEDIVTYPMKDTYVTLKLTISTIASWNVGQI